MKVKRSEIGSDIDPVPLSSLDGDEVGVRIGGEDRPRLTALRQRLQSESESEMTPLDFVAGDGNDSVALSGPNAAETVEDTVRRQVATAWAAAPQHIDFENAANVAVLEDTFGRQHSYLRWVATPTRSRTVAQPQAVAMPLPIPLSLPTPVHLSSLSSCLLFYLPQNFAH